MNNMRRDYEEDDIDNVFDEQEEEKCPLNDFLLFKLAQCAKPSRMNLIDKGSPRAYAELAVLRYTTAIEGGYQVTPEGYALLSRWSRKLQKI